LQQNLRESISVRRALRCASIEWRIQARWIAREKNLTASVRSYPNEQTPALPGRCSDALPAIVSFDRLENFITMRGVAGAGIAESVRWFHWIDAAGAYCDSTHKAVF
jgi:hypothetical protein